MIAWQVKRDKIIFTQCFLAIWLFLLCCEGDTSIVAHSCTVSHMLAWINTAQSLEKWILSGKMQPLPTQWIDAEGPLNSVYAWLVWSCSCILMKYHPLMHGCFGSSTGAGWIFPVLYFHVLALMSSAPLQLCGSSWCGQWGLPAGLA